MGNKFYYKDGSITRRLINSDLHRLDGPAAIDGTHLAWAINNEILLCSCNIQDKQMTREEAELFWISHGGTALGKEVDRLWQSKSTAMIVNT